MGVDIPGCEPLCMKVVFNTANLDTTFQEVCYMQTLSEVPGLPRVLGFCTSPLAFLMTRHGSHTLRSAMDGEADELELTVI